MITKSLFTALAALLVLLLASAAHAQPVDEPPAGDETTTVEVEESMEEPAAPPPPVDTDYPDSEPEPDPEPTEKETTASAAQQEPGHEKGITLVKAGWGNMRLFGILHAQLAASDLADTADARHTEFRLARMNLVLAGNFWNKKIGYYIEGDMANVAGFLLDARISIKPVQGLEIRIGRFIPDFTYFMPACKSGLMAIDYPLVTSSLAPWHQVGLEIMFQHKYFDIVAGVFNGMRFKKTMDPTSNVISTPEMAEGYTGATWENLSDDNMGKDLLFKLLVKPVKGLALGSYVYYGMPQYSWRDTGINELTDEMANMILYGFEVLYLSDKFNILFECAMRRLYYPDGATFLLYNEEGPGYPAVSPDPLVSHGAYLHAGYRFISMLEIMLRGDYFDADLDSDLGQEIWGMLGLNWYLDGIHARMTLEYILKARQRWEDPDAPEEDLETEYYVDHGVYFQLALFL